MQRPEPVNLFMSPYITEGQLQMLVSLTKPWYTSCYYSRWLWGLSFILSDVDTLSKVKRERAGDADT